MRKGQKVRKKDLSDRSIAGWDEIINPTPEKKEEKMDKSIEEARTKRAREYQEEKYLTRLVFESCQKLDESLVLQEEEHEIFLVKKVGTDSVTASLVSRGGNVGYGNRGWPAIEFGTNVPDISPRNWYRLMDESYAKQETKERHEVALPKKIVKALNETATALENFRANEALKKMADTNKVDAVKVALAGVAKVTQAYGSRAEVTLHYSCRQYQVEETYDGSFDIWVGTVRVSKAQLVKLIDFLDRHVLR